MRSNRLLQLSTRLCMYCTYSFRTWDTVGYCEEDLQNCLTSSWDEIPAAKSGPEVYCTWPYPGPEPVPPQRMTTVIGVPTTRPPHLTGRIFASLPRSSGDVGRLQFTCSGITVQVEMRMLLAAVNTLAWIGSWKDCHRRPWWMKSPGNHALYGIQSTLARFRLPSRPREESLVNRCPACRPPD
jgi:hypothetical protein